MEMVNVKANFWLLDTFRKSTQCCTPQCCDQQHIDLITSKWRTMEINLIEKWQNGSNYFLHLSSQELFNYLERTRISTNQQEEKQANRKIAKNMNIYFRNVEIWMENKSTLRCSNTLVMEKHHTETRYCSTHVRLENPKGR